MFLKFSHVHHMLHTSHDCVSFAVHCQRGDIEMGYYPRLRDLREDKDLSMRKLADLLHMQKTTYYNYETGKRELPFELAVTLARFYDVSLDYIGGLTNDTTPPHKR